MYIEAKTIGSVNNPINNPTTGNKNIFFEMFSISKCSSDLPTGNIVKKAIAPKRFL
jgi:hypothetical protein